MFNIGFLKDITIIGLLNLKDYIIIGFEVILVVTLSSINIVSKIKKVTPIKLINSNQRQTIKIKTLGAVKNAKKLRYTTNNKKWCIFLLTNLLKNK